MGSIKCRDPWDGNSQLGAESTSGERKEQEMIKIAN